MSTKLVRLYISDFFDGVTLSTRYVTFESKAVQNLR